MASKKEKDYPPPYSYDYTVIHDLNYHVAFKAPDNFSKPLDKGSLDLFLPKLSKHPQDHHRRSRLRQLFHSNEGDENSILNADRKVPVAVFVHGGSWRRGDKQLWRHYLSRYDSNFLIAFFAWLTNCYSNIGVELARNGIACAVISYPLCHLKNPCHILFEVFTSAITSLVIWTMLAIPWIIPVVIYYALNPDKVIFVEVESAAGFLSGRSADVWNWVHILLIYHQLGTWLCMFIFKKRYKLPIYYVPLPMIFSVIILPLDMLRMELRLLILTILHMVIVQGTIFCLQMREGKNSQVDYKVQTREVCRAIAWIKDLCNLDNTILDINNIFLMGHSAGTHLLMQGAIVESYFEEAGILNTDIKGIICICGVFDIPKIAENPLLQGAYIYWPFGRDEEEWSLASPMFYIRKMAKNKENAINNCELPDIDNNINTLETINGKCEINFDGEESVKLSVKEIPKFKDASQLPPVLLIGAQWDLMFIRKPFQRNYKTFVKAGFNVEAHVMPHCNHFSICADFGKRKRNCEELCVKFIRDNCEPS